MKGIIVILIFAGALVAVQFYAFPWITEVREQWADIEKMQVIIKNAEDTREKRAEYLDRLDAISEDDLRKLGLLVPSKVASEDLYVFLNDIVRASSLEMEALSIADSSDRSDGKEGQKALTFDIRVVGSYSDMRELLATMESNLRLMDIETLKISRARAADSQSQSAYELTIQGKFYYGGNE